jgi:hypothetical protein
LLRGKTFSSKESFSVSTGNDFPFKEKLFSFKGKNLPSREKSS